MGGFIAICEIELLVPQALSLKEKRQAVRSIMERVRLRCGASVAESDFLDVWQRAGLIVAIVSGRRDDLERRVNLARRIIDDNDAVEVGEFSVDWL